MAAASTVQCHRILTRTRCTFETALLQYDLSADPALNHTDAATLAVTNQLFDGLYQQIRPDPLSGRPPG